MCKQVLSFCCQSIQFRSFSCKILSAIQSLKCLSQFRQTFVNLSLCTCIMVFQDLLCTCDFLEQGIFIFLTCKAEINLILHSSCFCPWDRPPPSSVIGVS